jgi:hypothetical protein
MAKNWSEFRMITNPKTGKREYLNGLENRRGDELDLFFGRERLRKPGDKWLRPIPGGSLRGPGV